MSFHVIIILTLSVIMSKKLYLGYCLLVLLLFLYNQIYFIFHFVFSYSSLVYKINTCRLPMVWVLLIYQMCLCIAKYVLSPLIYVLLLLNILFLYNYFDHIFCLINLTISVSVSRGFNYYNFIIYFNIW